MEEINRGMIILENMGEIKKGKILLENMGEKIRDIYERKNKGNNSSG